MLPYHANSRLNFFYSRQMVPYFRLDRIPFLGSDSFSFFLLGGFVFGFLWFMRRARQYGFGAKDSCELFTFTTIPAFFGAHFFHLFFYEPHALAKDSWVLLRLNSGLASFGGILSFFIFFFAYLAITRKLSAWRIWIDAVIQGCIVGLFVGRIGCTLIHDHWGLKSDFFLAIQFPDGPRHDLGFYELLYVGLFLFPITLIAHRLKARAGVQFFLFALLYGTFRFLMDPLRISDSRYAGFTPAQYGSIVLLALGVFTGWCALRAAREKSFFPSSRQPLASDN